LDKFGASILKVKFGLVVDEMPIDKTEFLWVKSSFFIVGRSGWTMVNVAHLL
jgi:hypothetical protein